MATQAIEGPQASTEASANPATPPKRKRGRPKKGTEKPSTLLKAAQSLPADPRSKKGRPLGGKVTLDTSEAEVAKWASGHGLRDAARRVIGLALQTIDAVLRGGRIVNGIRPEVALAHAMSNPLLKVAGYDDKAPAAPAVTLVQIAVGQPGTSAGVSGQVLEAVRVSEEPKLLVPKVEVSVE